MGQIVQLQGPVVRLRGLVVRVEGLVVRYQGPVVRHILSMQVIFFQNHSFQLSKHIILSQGHLLFPSLQMILFPKQMILSPRQLKLSPRKVNPVCALVKPGSGTNNIYARPAHLASNPLFSTNAKYKTKLYLYIRTSPAFQSQPQRQIQPVGAWPPCPP